MNSLAVRVIRISCAVVFVAGIAGMIITTIAGNNVGLVTTIGITTAVAAIVLLVTAVATNTSRPEVFNEADTQRLERRIADLVRSGANETELRAIVRDATQLGRRS